jgi:hypothetical protein
MNLVRVESFPDFRKDISNGGVVNSNKDSYASYIEKKKRVLSEQAEKDAMKDEINSMKQDINEIKNMLTLLLDKQ